MFSHGGSLSPVTIVVVYDKHGVKWYSARVYKFHIKGHDMYTLYTEETTVLTTVIGFLSRRRNFQTRA